MKITSVRARVVDVPADEPLADGEAGAVVPRRYVALKIGTDAGVEGIGVACFGGALTRALHAALEDLGGLIAGMDPARPELVAQKINGAGGAAGGAGPGGLLTLAMSAIDIALWDIRGKALGVPISALLGGAREAVPAYASGALMRTQSLKDIERAARLLVERGWTAMKTQLALPGETSPAKEIERIRILREIAGPDARLMCDINQRWSPDQAVSIGQQIEPYGLEWLEDVTVADDYAGLARVRDRLTTPIAGGEYVWGIVPFRHMLEARSVDIVMIDLARAGGITPWLKIAGMAEAFNVPVVSHLLPEIHVHLI
ncbi:unnamed protein product, partial [Phaeothamnion confervicola]